MRRPGERTRSGGKREEKEGGKKRKKVATLGECSEFVNGSVFKCYPWNFARSTFTGARRKVKKKKKEGKKKESGKFERRQRPPANTHTHTRAYTNRTVSFLRGLWAKIHRRNFTGVIFNPRLGRSTDGWRIFNEFIYLFPRTDTYTFEISSEEQRERIRRRGGGGDRFQELKFLIRRIFYDEQK